MPRFSHEFAVAEDGGTAVSGVLAVRHLVQLVRLEPARTRTLESAQHPLWRWPVSPAVAVDRYPLDGLEDIPKFERAGMERYLSGSA